MFGAIAGLASLIAGTALQARAAQQARLRQQQAIAQALQRQSSWQHTFNQNQLQRQNQLYQQQGALQQQAENAVAQRLPDFSPEARGARQQAMEQQLAKTLSPQASTHTSGAQGQFSQDYLLARARAQANVLHSAQKLARLLGKTTAAQRLRQQEALDLNDTGLSLDRLHGQAQGMQRIAGLQQQASLADQQAEQWAQQQEQAAIQQAGVPNLWPQLAGGVLQGLGGLGLMRGFGGRAPMNPYQVPATLGGLSGPLNLSPWNGWGAR